MTTPTRTSVTRRSVLKLPLALAGAATVAQLAAFETEVKAADNATLRELGCHALRNCDSQVGRDLLINAHQMDRVAEEVKTRLHATFSPKQRELFWTYQEASEEADHNRQTDILFRFVDGLSKHFPEQAQAIRIIGAHLWRVEQGIGDEECADVLPPWAAYRWDACMGLVPLEETEADALS